MEQNYDVFISYSRRDYKDENNQIIPGNIVSQIKDMFDANGITYWFDEDGVFSGDAFAPVIARNIKAASIFLFISSEHSNMSEWTSNEIATAHTYKKKIIPFKYDNSIYNDSVIIYIARLDYIDYPTNHKKAIQRLLESVQTYLKEEAAKKEQLQIEEERRRKAEITQQTRTERLQVIRDQIAQMENRKFEVEKEILAQEKVVVDLRNEKRILEANILELKNEENIYMGQVEPNPVASVQKTTQSPQNILLREWNQLISSMSSKHWIVNAMHILGMISCFAAFFYILTTAKYYMVIASALASLATAIGFYLMLSNQKPSIIMTLLPYPILIILTILRDVFITAQSNTLLVKFCLAAGVMTAFCLLPLFIRKKSQSAWTVLRKQAIILNSSGIWIYILCIIAMVVCAVR